jgi:calcineurin-like phosphoesterase family protein
MIYFTSDLHIGHDQPFIWRSRGFSSIEEHDEAIIDNINKTVDKGDTLIVLGDLSLGPLENVHKLSYIDFTVKVKVLIGNHDSFPRLDAYDDIGFDTTSFGYASSFTYHKWKFMLSHYPMLTTNFDDKGVRNRVWNLHGHTHSKNKLELWPQAGINVGVDANNLCPISIEEIIETIRETWNDER